MKTKITALIESLGVCKKYGELIIVEPIYIGDILEKIKQLGLYYDQRKCFELWGELDFSKSLQQIIEDSGWDTVDSPCKAHAQGESPEDCCCETIEQLKDNNARALFDFLLTIFND